MTNDNPDSIEINFDVSTIYNPKLLEPPDTKVFGGDDDTRFNSITLRVGRRPYAVNLTKYFLRNPNKDQNKYDIFKEFDFCLLFQTVSVSPSEGIDKLSTLGCKMRFTNNSPITVLEVMPKTEFIERASGKLSVTLDGNATVGLSVPNVKTELINDVTLATGAKLEAGIDADFRFNLSFSVLTPKVIALGSGDNQSEWVFYRMDQPLVGTHQLVSLLLVRRPTTKLNYEMNLYGTVTKFGFPTKFRTDEWLKLSAVVPEIVDEAKASPN